MLEARTAIRNLATYHPPLGGRVGLRLDFNENTAGCSPGILARLREMTADEIACYPEREPVEALVADYFGVERGELLLTNGVDEAIHLLCETYLEPGDEALIVVPTFAMYEISAAATGARVVKVPADQEFRFPAPGLLSGITSRTRLIAVANPNNPTGSVARPEDLLELARRAPQAALLVDEAYFEFYGRTLLRQWRALPNLFVARTFSKAYGLAGLRIGALLGKGAHISMIRRLASPYNVNGVALFCLPAALADESYVRSYVDQVRQGRDEFQRELKRWEIQYWPSQANFVLARFGPLNDAFIDCMRARGILVRDRSRDYGCEGCARLTLGTAEQTAQMIRAFREILIQSGASEARIQ
ncbi:MAG TPA: histidinol-phosphate transaminase [Candidatus Aquilonibacter sp.]|nr:histidinol-phosphate transaminase [Candidatus Aquilonibacter sp.]